MNTPNRSLLSRIRERDIQLAFVQLIQTSPSFREWVIHQLVPEAQLAEFEGVSHSVVDYFGETDIEIRFQDGHGTSHFILIECKVDAAFGANQIERYFKRGKKYQEKGFCDEFSVALLAPKTYTDEPDEFDGVITFESITEQLNDVSHDGIPFFRALYEKASAKEEGSDKASVISRVESRVYDRLNEFTSIDNPKTILEIEAQDRFKMYSTHPAHPDEIRYGTRLYFEDRTMICGIGVFNAPEDIHKRVYDVLAEHFDELDPEDAQTELSDRRLKSQGVVKKTIPIPEEPPAVTEEQVEEATTAVIELVNHYHPKIVEEFQ